MTLCAQYGNALAYYGNIQLGRFALPILSYGAWPEERPAQKGMLIGDWQEPEIGIPAALPTDTSAADNIAIIKRLRLELLSARDARHRQQLREQIEKARQDKVRAFQRAARIDEEETLFILLN